ncbi:MAG: pirin-like C-terminal cupin domain-containing protein [Bacteroidales bacterium]|nr:pirin-like C-terminal cupin domain-containing protein [Bacteroidales bacterium]
MEIPDNVIVKVICGEINDIRGPVEGIAAQPTLFDVNIPAGGSFEYSLNQNQNVAAYIFKGTAYFDDNVEVEELTSVVFGEGDSVRIEARNNSVRALLISGVPLNEEIAWNGPIVMNTEGELKTAFNEFRNGTFIKT